MELIGVAKKNDFIDQALISAYFSNAEKDRVLGKRTAANRKCTYLGILLLKYLMQIKMNDEEMNREQSERVQLCSAAYPPLEKPVLLDRDDKRLRLDFSVSHGDELVVCGLSDTKIGIDAEKIRAADFNIMPLVFSKEEIDYVYSQEVNKHERLFQVWTMKESFAKLMGKGLRYPLQSLSFVSKNKVSESVRIDEETHYFRTYRYENYLITVCSIAEIAGDLRVLSESTVASALQSILRSSRAAHICAIRNINK